MKYLSRKSFGYCFRIRVPVDLIDIMGQREIKYSLGTSNRRKAERQSKKLAKRIKVLFRKLRNGCVMLSRDEIKRLVRKFVDETKAEIEQRYDTNREILDHSSYFDQLDTLTCIQSELKEELAYRDRSGVYHLVDDLLKSEGRPIDRNSSCYQKLANEILKAVIHLFEHEINLAGTGGLNTGIAAEILKESECKDFGDISSKTQSHFMDQVADAFWKENSSNWKPRTVTENRTFHEHLLKYLNPDRMIHTVDYQTGREYKALLVTTRTNRRKLMSPARVDMYLGYASQLFNWAIKQHYTELNPFAGLQFGKKVQKRADKQREAFTVNDLKKMFVESEYFGQDKWGKANHPHFFWIPLLGLFTGARLEEIAQLYVKDVKVIDGVACLDINETRPDQSVKTGEQRLIPLHDFLVKELDFIRYVEGLSKEIRVFPNLKRVNHRYSHGFSMWFSKFRNRCGVKGKKTFHSFRHLVTSSLLEKDVQEYRIAQLVGHTIENQTTGRYGKRFKLKILKEKVIDLLTYPIDLSHLKESKWANY